jgi:hypothetical protein
MKKITDLVEAFMVLFDRGLLTRKEIEEIKMELKNAIINYFSK